MPSRDTMTTKPSSRFQPLRRYELLSRKINAACHTLTHNQCSMSHTYTHAHTHNQGSTPCHQRSMSHMMDGDVQGAAVSAWVFLFRNLGRC